MLLKQIPSTATKSFWKAILRCRGISSQATTTTAATTTTTLGKRNSTPATTPYQRQYHTASSSRFGGNSVCFQSRNHLRRRSPVEPQYFAANANTHTNTHTNTHSNKTTTTTKRWHGGPHVDRDRAESIRVTFVDGDGRAILESADVFVGESLLQAAQRNGIELEGACEGVCACSTCHVIFPDSEVFDGLEEASEDEEDMLDMAYGLTETSRLSCQILITKELDGITVEIPRATRNFYVDGHVPQPH